MSRNLMLSICLGGFRTLKIGASRSSSLSNTVTLDGFYGIFVISV